MNDRMILKTKLLDKLHEALAAVLPIVVLVLLLRTELLKPLELSE